MARPCLFCGNNGGSREDASPKWLAEVLEGLGGPPNPKTDGWRLDWSDTRTGEKRSREHPAKRYDTLVYKALCTSCNTGWMARLQGRARPLLTPMIEGRPHTLTQNDLLTVATWATMTAIVVEARDYEDVNFPESQRRLVMREERPPASVVIFAACAEIKGQPQSFSRGHGKVDVAGKELEYTAMTMQFNTLVLQVLRPLDEGFFPAPFGHVPEDRTIELPVYPPGSEFYWPPQRSITRKSDLTKYARREQLDS